MKTIQEATEKSRLEVRSPEEEQVEDEELIYLIRRAQSESFSQEIDRIKKGGDLEKTPCLLGLTLF